MTAYAWLLAAAALAAAAGSVPYVAHAVHALAPYAVTGLWVVALWASRRARARAYHRHRWEHAHCHARPTLARRLRLTARRLRALRLTTSARTA